jgi:chromate transporter
VTGPAGPGGPPGAGSPGHQVPLAIIVRHWGRIGILGFGGPPTHIALLRALCVTDRGWLSATEFEDGIAATNLLPGPASTQLAIYCAWRLAGTAGALAGGLCFILPGLVVILALSAVFFGAHPPLLILGAAAGAGAAVPAVAVHAALGLLPGSWQRVGTGRPARARWVLFVVAGGVAAASVGPWLVVVLVACGALEIAVRSRPTTRPGRAHAFLPVAFPAAVAAGGLAAIAWVALKVGALSYGGGFVIVPLMQHDAVHTYHWMTGAQFLDAVALGQLTPGPVVQTVAAVGYAAAGIGGGLLAAAVAFAPSFLFVLVGGRHFDRIRANLQVRSFLIGAGAASLGAIAGSAVPLGAALSHEWQAGVLVVAAGWLFALRRGVVAALAGAALLGVIAALAGAPVPH